MRLGGQLQFVAFSEMKHAPSKMGEQQSKPLSWCVCVCICISISISICICICICICVYTYVYIYIYLCVCVLRWVMIGVGCLEHSGFP